MAQIYTAISAVSTLTRRLPLMGFSAGGSNEACCTTSKRYHALALRIHPDKTSAPRAAEAFQALEAAFHALAEKNY